MSATLAADARQELELTVYTRLNRLINEVTDPVRLDRLLAMALRVKPHPRQPEKVASTPPAPTPPPAPESPLPEFRLPTLNGELLPPPNLGLNVGPTLSSPPLLPMTDDEFLKLSRQIGHTEAHRRRLIRAHLIREQQRSDDESP